MINPISKLLDKLTRPNKINRVATMMVNIKKGESKGEAWVPCTFETLSYGIDVNPTLLKRVKGKKNIYKKVKVPLDKPFTRHEDERLELDDNEEIIYEEVERCEHCGKKIIISEIQTTKYRSCPLVSIKLSDPATEDLSIPVKFGFNTYQLYAYMGLFAFIGWMGLLFMSVIEPITLIIGSVLTIIGFGFVGRLLK